jgi:hypothetical protein
MYYMHFKNLIIIEDETVLEINFPGSSEAICLPVTDKYSNFLFWIFY